MGVFAIAASILVAACAPGAGSSSDAGSSTSDTTAGGETTSASNTTAPVTTSEVTVTTCDDLISNMLAGGRAITLGADVAVGITGIAGPGGGSDEKPVGTVCFSVRVADGPPHTRTIHLPGNWADIRERSTTVAMHMLRRVLSGQSVSV